MKQRAISAIIFLAVMLGGIFGGPVTFLLLCLFITGGALWELHGLMRPEAESHRMLRRVTGTVFGMLPALAVVAGKYTQAPASAYVLWGGVLAALFFAFLVISELFMEDEQPFRQISIATLGLVYVGLPLSLLPVFAFWQGDYSAWSVLGILLLNWTNDTMAYLTGTLIGRSPFFKRISPKKTWEGTLGGILFTILAAALVSMWIPVCPLRVWLAIGACVAVFGTLGDLVESMLKRSLGIKDSGNILPGHGGFLDRFDSMIFLLPFVWLVLALS